MRAGLPRLACCFAFALAAAPAPALEQSYAPVFGYGPTAGFQYGAGAFFKRPGLFTQFIGVSSEYGVFWLQLDVEQDLGASLLAEYHGSLTNYFDAYFGEGMDTRPGDRVRLDKRATSHEAILWVKADGFDLGPCFEWRRREDLGVEGDPARRLFSDESNAVAGFHLRRDRRDDKRGPRRGSYADLEAGAHPDSGSGAFAQYGVDLRAYTPLAAWLSLATRAEARTTVGLASYSWRYQLGGETDLRGFESNRFRGAHKVQLGAELRTAYWHWLAATAFAEAGEVGDALTGRLEPAGGGGIRIALPPDKVQCIRIDVGSGKDWTGVFMEFGQVF